MERLESRELNGSFAGMTEKHRTTATNGNSAMPCLIGTDCPTARVSKACLDWRPISRGRRLAVQNLDWRHRSIERVDVNRGDPEDQEDEHQDDRRADQDRGGAGDHLDSRFRPLVVLAG